MHKIIDSLKYIKLKDIFTPFIFLLAIIPAFIYKAYLAIKKQPLWLICEDGNTARDNGYYFYKYMRDKHPEVNCRYVIRKTSDAYEKIAKLGKKPIEMSSFRHYVSYLAAKWNISNHKHGNPNQPLFYVIHVILNLYNNRVFLQHGITTNDSPWIYYKNTKFRFFICATKPEYDFVKEKFGYPEENVVLAGFPRFDTLVDESKNKKQILIMPTWRNWLGRETNSLSEKEEFESTNYYKGWNSLLTNKEFIEYIEENKIKVLFYPHQHMQKYIDKFHSCSKNIEIIGMGKDIQKAMRESGLMITDYSSVFMDFAYMCKPVIYYQFDYDEYRKRQLGEGFFDFKKNGFGPVVNDAAMMIEAMSDATKGEYSENRKSFFTFNDSRNCRRVYEKLIEVNK